MQRIVAALLLTASVLLPGQLRAQAESPEDLERELRSMVVSPTAADVDRQMILDFLDREDVRDVATGHGVDPEGLQDRVATLDDESTSELADRVRGVQEDLAQVGGDTFVITSTTVIIILLVLILILVA
ncbi:MAG: PA2779 family protein [Longimicrobiales bacterium]|nr:PA2779 family protein [Longimicrobiales bacterium]